MPNSPRLATMTLPHSTNPSIPLGITTSFSSKSEGALTLSADGNYLIPDNRPLSLTPEFNAYSGDNPHAMITADRAQFYMAGNSDSTTYQSGYSGPSRSHHGRDPLRSI